MNFEFYIENGNFIFIIINSKGLIEYANKYACDLSCYQRDELVNSQPLDIFTIKDEKAKIKQVFNEIVIGKRNPVEHFTCYVINKKNQKFYISWKLLYEMNENRSIERIICYGRDLTSLKGKNDDNKKTIRKLKESRKEGKFFYNFISIKENLSIDDFLQKTVDLIPNAKPFPSKTYAKIKYKDKEYFKNSCEEIRESYSKEIKVKNKVVGYIEIGYYENISQKRDIAFVKNEKKFISELSKRISKTIELNQTRNELSHTQDVFKIAIENSNTGVWDWNFKTGEITLSKEWKTQLGYDESDDIDEFNFSITNMHHDDRDRAMKMQNDLLLGKIKEYNLEYRLKCKDGKYKWILSKAKVSKWDEYGNPERITGTHSDISQLKDLQIELEKQAVMDSLTGLYNHRLLVQKFEYESSRSKRYKDPFSLIMIDIDNFKNINDTKGHLEGDKVLKMVGEIIKKNIRKIDIPFRIGGDEFLIMLPSSNLNSAKSLLNRIKNELSNLNTLITISAGLKEWSGESFEKIFKSADEKLYKAKGKGKNRIEY